MKKVVVSIVVAAMLGGIGFGGYKAYQAKKLQDEIDQCRIFVAAQTDEKMVLINELNTKLEELRIRADAMGYGIFGGLAQSIYLSAKKSVEKTLQRYSDVVADAYVRCGESAEYRQKIVGERVDITVDYNERNPLPKAR